MDKQLREILKRKQEIRSILNSQEDCDVDALEKELDSLEKRQLAIEKRKDLADKIGSGEIVATEIENLEERKVVEYGVDSKEYRSAFFKKIPCIKKITVSYNRITLMMFYAVGGFIVFSLCGIFGLIVACLLWVSFVVVFLMLFLTTSISNFDSSSSSSSSSSDHKKKLKGKEMSSSSD